MNAKRALICGVSGQDGAYLAELLVRKGYEVHGTTRLTLGHPPANLELLGIHDCVQVHQLQPVETENVRALLEEVQPTEIYYLAAQSSVWRSFQEPAVTFMASAVGLLTVLEAAREIVPAAKVLNAASGDCFGDTSADAPASEDTAFDPRSPYGAAKCAGHHALSVTRLAHRQFACSAYLFTHESPLRTEAFAIGKLAASVKRIAAGSDEKLELGNVEVVRDWGWAPDYVDAMWLMLQQDEPRDFVIATGFSCRLSELVELAFAEVGLEWREHVIIGALAPRPTDIASQHADTSYARAVLGWRAQTCAKEMIGQLVRS